MSNTATFTIHTEDYLSPYIENVIIKSAEQKDTRKSIIAKGLVTILGSMAGIPYANAAYQAAGTIPVLGHVFAGGTIIAYAAGAIWILHNIVDEFTPISAEEQKILNNGKYYAVFRHVTSNVLGSIVSLIPIYTAYKFNTIGWLSLITVPISIAFSAFDFYNMFNGFSINQIKNIENLKQLLFCRPKPFSEKEILVSRVSSALATIHLSSDKIIEISTILFEDSKTAGEFISALINLQPTFNDEEKSFFNDTTRFVSQLASVPLPICTAIVNAFLAYEASTLIFDNLIFSIFFIIMTSLPSFFTDLLVTSRTADSIYNALKNKLSRVSADDFLAARFPRLSSTLTGISFILAALSSSNRGYISYSTVDNSAKLFITTFTVISSTIFETYALKDLSHKFTYFFIKKLGSDQNKLIIHIQEQLLKLNKVLEKATDDKLAGFFNKLDQAFNRESYLEINRIEASNMIINQDVVNHHDSQIDIERTYVTSTMS